MIMIKSISIEVENAIKIDEIVQSGEYNSFSSFIREAVNEKLKRTKGGW